MFLLKLKCVFELAGKHTEALLNKPREQDLVQLVPNTENNMGSKISEKTNKFKDLSVCSQKLEVDVAIFRNVKFFFLNELLIKRNSGGQMSNTNAVR